MSESATRGQHVDAQVRQPAASVRLGRAPGGSPEADRPLRPRRFLRQPRPAVRPRRARAPARPRPGTGRGDLALVIPRAPHEPPVRPVRLQAHVHRARHTVRLLLPARLRQLEGPARVTRHGRAQRSLHKPRRGKFTF